MRRSTTQHDPLSAIQRRALSCAKDGRIVLYSMVVADVFWNKW
jgi:hypothetical protein